MIRRDLWLPGRSLRMVVGIGILWNGILGCSGDTTGPALQNPTQAYWTIQLNQHAVNLALTPPYDTVQLTATPLNAAGTPLTGVDSLAHYSVLDSSITVSATGLVQAHYVTNQTQVIVTLTTQGVTLTDTVFVQVTATPLSPALKTFSLTPAPGDSAKRAYDVAGGLPWTVTATDVAGDTVCDSLACSLQVYYTSSNPQVATIDRSAGTIGPSDTGHVVFTATTLAYGVPMRASVDFTIGYEIYPIVPIADSVGPTGHIAAFEAPPTYIVGVGAIVTFSNQSRRLLDVVFDQPSAFDTASTTIEGRVFGPPTGSGNIPAFGGDTVNPFNNLASRRILGPGSYRYHSTIVPSVSKVLLVQVQH